MSLVNFRAQNHPQQPIRDEVDDRGTTVEDFAFFDQLGPFTLDVAAAPHNAKCEKFFTIHDDGLRQSWAGETVWCNPPYSNLGAWVKKAWQESASANGIAMLLPANRTEQGWWQQWIESLRDRPGSPLKVTFLPGRMRFILPGATRVGANERPPFGCCLVTWDLNELPQPRTRERGLFEPPPPSSYCLRCGSPQPKSHDCLRDKETDRD
jgi:phage N-6-adenine-methyltransferase